MYNEHMSRCSYVHFVWRCLMVLDHKSCCETEGAHEAKTKEVLLRMPPEDELFDLADFFKVFGDSTRLKILSVLLCSEMCVNNIAEVLSLSQSAVSHQLRFLKQMKLVEARRDGKTVYYSLTDSHIESILSQGLEHIRE